MPNLEPTEYELRIQRDNANARADRYARLQGEQLTLAADMRRVAGNLEHHVEPLRTVFTPVRNLHTATTWTGNAATESRNRLDDHESRCNGAISSIDTMIDDLHTQAQVASTAAAGYGADALSARQTVWNLDNQIEEVYAV